MMRGWQFDTPRWVFGAAAAFIALGTAAQAQAGVDKPKDAEKPVDELTGKALIDALKGGGYVIYFRHGKTDHSTYDTDRDNLENCTKQRLLSQEGRDEMLSIGKTIGKLGIRVSRVVSSPYCRSIDTAVLAFGTFVTDEDLKHTVVADAPTVQKQAVALRRLLGQVPEAGTNSVISGHTANLKEATGVWPDPEGVAVVFRPLGNSRFEYVATIAPDAWKEFLKLK